GFRVAEMGEHRGFAPRTQVWKPGPPRKLVRQPGVAPGRTGWKPAMLLFNITAAISLPQRMLPQLTRRRLRHPAAESARIATAQSGSHQHPLPGPAEPGWLLDFARRGATRQIKPFQFDSDARFLPATQRVRQICTRLIARRLHQHRALYAV